MEFRAPAVATALNAEVVKYFTKNLSNPEVGRKVLDEVMSELGSAVESFPDWHPILTAPPQKSVWHASSLSMLSVYDACEHTRRFVKGFITCPYSEDAANQLTEDVNQILGLHAYRLDVPLYADNAYPVVVEALEVELEADGTIRSRDAIKWFSKKMVKEADNAQVAETWWNIRSYILGQPYGARSSLFVNQYTGVHMRKILEALNNSGLFGPIREMSLEMLSKKKRDRINETLLRAALSDWDKKSENFTFELRGEVCKATMRDTWDDGYEISIRVEIGKYDLFSRGYYYVKDDRITYTDPTGKRALAEKFL